MTVVIDGTTGIDTVQDGAIVAADIAAGAVTQTKLASGVAGTGPAFAASDTATTATSSTNTKIVFDTELFDTDNAFDGTKFQPTVAGYYSVSLRVVNTGNTNVGFISAIIYKNGSVLISSLNSTGYYPAGSQVAPQFTALVYLNGSTDYIEFYGNNNGNANIGLAYATGYLVRAA